MKSKITPIKGELLPKKVKKKWQRTPSHAPTDQQRAQVYAYAAVGVPHTDIAALISISTPTLLKHYAEELKKGKANANAEVGKRLFAQTQHSVAAAIFWLKAQAGWREVHVIAGDRDNPLAFETVAKEVKEVSKEEAEQAYLRLIAE